MSAKIFNNKRLLVTGGTGSFGQQFVKDTLAKHENSFTLQSHGVGKYGRCLGEIILNEVNLNDLLITEGHAVKYDGGKR